MALATGILSAGFSKAYAVREFPTIDKDNWILYGLIGFFATLSVYNGQRLFKLRRNARTPWLQWVAENRVLLWLMTFFSGIVAGFLFYLIWSIRSSSDNVLITVGFSSLISLFYVVRIKGRNLREIPYIKIHLIALTWVAVLIAFPLMNERRTEHLIWISIAHYLYILAVTIPFDIRDLKYDSPLQKTIPQVIGVDASRILSVMLLVVFSIMMLYLDERLWTNALFYISVLVQVLLVLLMNEKRPDTYCAGLIDGAIALLGLSYLFNP